MRRKSWRRGVGKCNFAEAFDWDIKVVRAGVVFSGCFWWLAFMGAKGSEPFRGNGYTSSAG
jgi:phage shock protein PspC (stress-responsive transcriptional regulator)